MNNRNINKQLLSTNINIRKDYQHNLENKLNNLNHEMKNSEVCEEIAVHINSVADETIGYNEKKKNIKKYDPEIELLSEKQRQLHLKISNCKELNKNQNLRKQRNEIMRRIKQKIVENKEK